jgi:hypothetical protein
VLPPTEAGGMSVPAQPAPIAAERQSKPSSTLWTTGPRSGSMATGRPEFGTGWRGAGRALAADAARAAVARLLTSRRMMRSTFMTASFRGGRKY